MFAEKVVLITGAGSGIGAATAVKFAKSGAKLSLTGRNGDNLRTVAIECENLSSEKPLVTIGDILVEDSIENILKLTINHFGRLDVLINNAGIAENGSIENTSVAQFDRVFNTNVRAVYNMTMKAVPFLIQTKGNIVNVSSLTGTRAFPGALAYGMSKAAVNQLTRCVALELASRQVRVNSVNPGVVRTELQRRAGMSEQAYQKMIENCKFTHALGRSASPEEVADAIHFLASENSSFITGINLLVDGGRHAMCPY
ncbi:3-oxoacyl-[acyl-carrier-protein] reductase FabG-like [Homalodisca vitripennis]|uniref:3-oxoacyl-[acyl-carrier-protein] reductase FabG-like n=1 Tax=Homalodisca vitripennis TaxID=197043 RepID=UPI001EEBFCEB|nr:3-oxoacyl-[acyl-carrier-protein] reductase FabG-like [Homalodisca vitripennis]XP_046689024.1 3-oxoacyl-[acyl-carrier-protein] reductase FabG-like [Homalodisca vitripennis]KAG8302745.1 hypothetical protein J6590_025020 [Homalodisca vitripennis]